MGLPGRQNDPTRRRSILRHTRASQLPYRAKIRICAVLCVFFDFGGVFGTPKICFFRFFVFCKIVGQKSQVHGGPHVLGANFAVKGEKKTSKKGSKMCPKRRSRRDPKNQKRNDIFLVFSFGFFVISRVSCTRERCFFSELLFSSPHLNSLRLKIVFSLFTKFLVSVQPKINKKIKKNFILLIIL